MSILHTQEPAPELFCPECETECTKYTVWPESGQVECNECKYVWEAFRPQPEDK